MDHIKRYRQRRAARLGFSTSQRYDSVDEYRRRRKERLKERGYREDDGNQRLPFGLCKRYGIEIGKDWGPKEAWEALAGKGITPDNAYEHLENGEDPATGEKKKPTIEARGMKITDLDLKRIMTDDGPIYILAGKDESGRLAGVMKGYESATKTLAEVKERYGVDPKDLDLAPDVRQEWEKHEEREKEFEKSGVTFWRKRYLNPTIEPAEKEGMFRISATNEHGEREDIVGMLRPDQIASFLENEETDLSKIKNVPEEIKNAIEESKQEKERVARAFEESTVEVDGRKLINLCVVPGYANMFVLRGTDKDGYNRIVAKANTYEELLKRAKDEYGIGEDKIKDGEGVAEFKKHIKDVEEAVKAGTHRMIDDEAFSDFEVTNNGAEGFVLYGTDVDGNRKRITGFYDRSELDRYLKDKGVEKYKYTDLVGKYKVPGLEVALARAMKMPDGKCIVKYTTSGNEKSTYEAKDETEAMNWLMANGFDTRHGFEICKALPNDDIERPNNAKSLQNFEEHRMERGARCFVRDLSPEDQQLATEMMTEIMSKGAYRFERSTDSFFGILTKGYLPQPAIGYGGSGAAQNIDLRMDVSNDFYGHGNIGKSQYEKYGYLGFDDDVEDYREQGLTVDYGGDSAMTYTLKKSAMKDRTTYTMGDSLNMWNNVSTPGYAGDHPTIDGLSALGSESKTHDILDYYRDYKDGAIDYTTFMNMAFEEMSGNYLELQFHGPVKAKDIEKVTFPSVTEFENAFDKMTPENRKQAISILKRNKIKIGILNMDDEIMEDGWDYIRERYGA